MSDIIEEKDNVLSFTLFKVEKGREKICKCNPPHYEIDMVNRIVTCMDCGATLDAFEALVTFCNHIKDYEEYQEKALSAIELYGEWANEELRRRFRNKAFKDMDAEYKRGMLPHCPKCGEAFEPMKITRWTNRKYYEESEVNNEQDKFSKN